MLLIDFAPDGRGKHQDEGKGKSITNKILLGCKKYLHRI